MLESVQDTQGITPDVFRTVASPETADIFLKAAAQTGAEIVHVEVPAQRTGSIGSKVEPEAESGQEEVMVKVSWETKEQQQDFWIAFDIEWRKAFNP